MYTLSMLGIFLAQRSIAQESEWAKMMKYQLEAKDPGIAALIAVTSPIPGIAHHYVEASDRGRMFIASYVGGIAAIFLGLNMKTSIPTRTEIRDGERLEVETGEELSGTGEVFVFGGIAALLITKTLESSDAYQMAVAYNAKLLEKYNLDLSVDQKDRAFQIAYRF